MLTRNNSLQDGSVTAIPQTDTALLALLALLAMLHIFLIRGCMIISFVDSSSNECAIEVKRFLIGRYPTMNADDRKE
jgi:hypothetical protein